jgi:hypothetical protein
LTGRRRRGDEPALESLATEQIESLGAVVSLPSGQLRLSSRRLTEECQSHDVVIETCRWSRLPADAAGARYSSNTTPIGPGLAASTSAQADRRRRTTQRERESTWTASPGASLRLTGLTWRRYLSSRLLEVRRVADAAGWIGSRAAAWDKIDASSASVKAQVLEAEAVFEIPARCYLLPEPLEAASNRSKSDRSSSSPGSDASRSQVSAPLRDVPRALIEGTCFG